MNKTSFITIKTILTPFLLLLLGITHVFAQNNPIVLDTTFLKCEYKTNYYTDTIKMDDGIWVRDEFILQVGQKTSKYFSKLTDSYEKAKNDSETWNTYVKGLQIEMEMAKDTGGKIKKDPLARHGAQVVYTNFPKDKRTIQDAVFFDYYIYEDDNLPQQWTMVADSVKTILGYNCRKATCTYRGRDYEAWYAVDLPVSAGPWKFSGLTGLIMSVQDSKGHYTFDIAGLEKTQEPIEYIEYGARKYTHTDRKTFLKTNAKASRIGLTRYLQANAPSSQSNTDIKFSGGEAKYDLQERDY